MTDLLEGPVAAPGVSLRAGERRGATLSFRVLGGVFCVVLALGVIAYWPEVAHPSLYRDDWSFVWDRLVQVHGYLGFAIRDSLKFNRPVYVFVNQLVVWAFGDDARPRMILALLIGACVSSAAFALLRQLGVGLLAAFAIAALLMVFPLSDSTHLVATMATTTLGSGLYMVGATLAVRSLSVPARAGRWLHAGALAFYLLSLLTYESAAGLILLSVLVYRVVVPWRVALSRWARDVAILAVLFGAYLIVNRFVGEHLGHLRSVSQVFDRVGVFVYESIGAIALTVFPAGPALVTRTVVLERAGALLALVCLVAALVWIHRDRDRETIAEVRRWVWVMTAAAAGLALAYLPYVVAAGDYHPLERGEGNKINQLAAIPLLLIAYALFRLVSVLILGSKASLNRHRSVAVCAAAALLAASVVTVRSDIVRWQYTAARQRDLQATVKQVLRNDPRQVSVIVVGNLDLFSPAIPHPPAPGEVANLHGTFAVPLGHPLGLEYLVAPATRYVCRTYSMYPVGSPTDETPYGATLLLNPAKRRIVRITDRATCVQQTA